MDQKQTTPEKELTTKFPVLYVAFELANSTWKMACSDGRKVRQVTVAARDLEQVERALLIPCCSLPTINNPFKACGGGD